MKHDESPIEGGSLAILLGASEFPNKPDLHPAPAFKRSYEGMRAYLLDPQGYRLKSESDLLDLFDSEMGYQDIDDAIATWLGEKQAQGNYANLIVYYVGHGGFREDSRDYFLAIRRTSKRNPWLHSIQVEAFARTLRTEARAMRRIVIFDACFSGSAQKWMGTANSIAEERIREIVWDDGDEGEEPEEILRGTALLSSSSEHDPSLYLDDNSTMFTGALLHALSKGSRSRPNPLSLTDVQQLTWGHLRRKYADVAVRPEVHSPEQRFGNVADLPIFPNRSAASPAIVIRSVRNWRDDLAKATSRVVGIDFGTSSSAIAVIHQGEPRLIPNELGAKLTPSVVALTRTGEWIVGEAAEAYAETEPERAITQVKRHFGTSWQIQIDGVTYTAPFLASLILSKLKADAEAMLGHQVVDCLPTIPAYYNSKQRKDFLEAARLAGLKPLRLVAEPTAAVLAHRDRLISETSLNVAVVDLGGGTFDVTILDIGDGIAEVEAVSGDPMLGGTDFDTCIVQELIRRFFEETGVDLSDDHIANHRLRKEAERAKIALSNGSETSISVNYIAMGPEAPLHLRTILSRVDFERLVENLYRRILRCCQEALTTSGVTQIDELVLVGLSTRIPRLRAAFTGLFGVTPSRFLDPDDAVALGAAIQAGILDGSEKGKILLDAYPFEVGLKIQNGDYIPVLRRNRTIPTYGYLYMSVTGDSDFGVVAEVIEKNPVLDTSVSLGFIRLFKNPVRSKNVYIACWLDVDTNGLLQAGGYEINREQVQYGHGAGFSLKRSNNGILIESSPPARTSGTVSVKVLNSNFDPKNELGESLE